MSTPVHVAMYTCTDFARIAIALRLASVMMPQFIYKFFTRLTALSVTLPVAGLRVTVQNTHRRRGLYGHTHTHTHTHTADPLHYSAAKRSVIFFAPTYFGYRRTTKFPIVSE